MAVPDGAIEASECVVDRVDLASIEARERVTRHDVKARIEEFNALAGHEQIHQGLTSRDLTENVEQLQIRLSLEHVRPARLPPRRLPAAARRARASRARRAPRGGNFALRFDGGDCFSRYLGAVYAVQRRFGLYYGDSTLWCEPALFTELGGYRELPIMDDYDFVRRLERATPTACLPGPATTSARRWRAMGVPRTVFAWFVIRWLYLAGVSPARLYRRVR